MTTMPMLFRHDPEVLKALFEEADAGLKRVYAMLARLAELLGPKYRRRARPLLLPAEEFRDLIAHARTNEPVAPLDPVVLGAPPETDLETAAGLEAYFESVRGRTHLLDRELRASSAFLLVETERFASEMFHQLKAIVRMPGGEKYLPQLKQMQKSLRMLRTADGDGGRGRQGRRAKRTKPATRPHSPEPEMPEP